jgi:peroxiredoxin
MPSLQALSEKYHNKDVEIIAVSVDHGREKAVKKWIAKNKLDFPIALEGQDAGAIYEVSALPVTFIIGKQGQLIGRILGERHWNDEETTQLIESLLVAEKS